MNTQRYNTDYYEKVIEFLKNTPNTVNLPSDVFFEIARLFENEQSNKVNLNKLFSKAYTLLAIENDEIVGIASMDNEGNIGIFAVLGDEKACKLLLNALERRAEKQELPFLFVLQTDNSERIFRNYGFEPFDYGEVNEFQLAKKIQSAEYVSCPQKLNPDSLSEYVPLNAVKMYKAISITNFVAFAAVLILMLLCAFLVARQSENYGQTLLLCCIPFAPFLLIFVCRGIYCLVLPIKTNKNYALLLNNAQAKTSAGRIICSNESKSYKKYYCEYSDGNEIIKTPVPNLFAKKMVQGGNTSVTVAFDERSAIVLVKKGKFPDEFLLQFSVRLGR